MTNTERIVKAAQAGDLGQLRELTTAGVDVNSSYIEFFTEGDTNAFKQTTPLVAAVKNGHTEVVRFLLEAGANINQTSSRFIDGKCDMFCGGNYEKVNGTAIYQKESPLSAAVLSENEEIANMLIARGADVNFRARVSTFNLPPIPTESTAGPLGCTTYPILHLAIRKRSSAGLVARILESGADRHVSADYYFNNSQTAWGLTIFAGSFCAEIPCLLAACVSKTARDWLKQYRKFSPAEVAARLGQQEVRELLLHEPSTGASPPTIAMY